VAKVIFIPKMTVKFLSVSSLEIMDLELHSFVDVCFYI
jgi:hypothetical protein